MCRYCPTLKAAQWERPGEPKADEDDLDASSAPRSSRRSSRRRDGLDPPPTARSARYFSIDTFLTFDCSDYHHTVSLNHVDVNLHEYLLPLYLRGEACSRIQPDAKRTTWEGKEWVQVWDPEESANYWYFVCNSYRSVQFIIGLFVIAELFIDFVSLPCHCKVLYGY